MYQACLLSLAVSDLLTAVFSGAGYINRLSKDMTLLWVNMISNIILYLLFNNQGISANTYVNNICASHDNNNIRELEDCCNNFVLN